MPYVEVNTAQIFYRTYGREIQDDPPILLIHGSTKDGQTEWSSIAPLLAQNHFVIVPDCRGHGHSSNPNYSYSFLEMASDFAVFLKNLGFQRAHVIGHSNGGNVALCQLIEYPYTIESCVLQAANAYVSQDLIDKEPGLFDPVRVEAKSPGWMQEMIELHGPIHGKDYWRDLLQMTVTEIIRAPNYSLEALSKVRKPVLVIQGEKDTVNNVGRHAQFISENIPDAGLWVPESVGHNVHKEIPTKWLDEINNFVD